MRALGGISAIGGRRAAAARPRARQAARGGARPRRAAARASAWSELRADALREANAFEPGWTRGAESWNGRLAMLGLVAAVTIELSTGQGVLHFFGIMP